MSVIPALVSTMVPAMTWLETMSASALQVNTALKMFQPSSIDDFYHVAL